MLLGGERGDGGHEKGRNNNNLIVRRACLWLMEHEEKDAGLFEKPFK